MCRCSLWIKACLLCMLCSLVPTAWSASGAGTQGLQVLDLRTEWQTSPLGIDIQHPRLSWKLDSQRRGAMQGAFQILVASSPDRLAQDIGDVWDSGRVSTTQPFGAVCCGQPLESRIRYYWKVRVWDEKGARSAWSTPSQWEMGLLSPRDWQARWIYQPRTLASLVPPGVTAQVSPTPGAPAPLLRTTFDVGKPVQKARLYVSGLAYAYTYLNGKKLGDRYLDPIWTVYDRHVPYVALDATPYIVQGRNALGVTLGRGMYGPWDGAYAAREWHDEPKLLLQLEIEYTDGSRSSVVSSPAWKVVQGPTLRDSLISGEWYDARLDHDGWTLPDYDDSAWVAAQAALPPAGGLQAERMEPIRVVGEMSPVSVAHPLPGVAVYDFGKATTGWARIAFNGPAGTQVEIDYGEKLAADGTVVHCCAVSGATTLQSDLYILKGLPGESWEPGFSYDSFRYVELRTTSMALPPATQVVARIAHSDIRRTGDFTSSNALFNKIHQAMVETSLNNLHSVPTDTPMYEKTPWMGDGHLFATSVMLNNDADLLYAKWTQDIRDDQLPDGLVGYESPTSGLRETEYLFISPSWHRAAWKVPWSVYLHYGDKRILEESYESLVAYGAFLERAITATGYVWEGYDFADWVAPGQTADTFALQPGREFMGTAHAYDAFRTLAQIATVLGRRLEADHYRLVAGLIKVAFNARFYDAMGRSYRYDASDAHRQSPNVVAIAFGLVSDDRIAAVAAAVAADVKAKGNHLDTGAIGTEYLLPILTQQGYGDLAYSIANQTDYPSWGQWLQSESTLFEQWGPDARSHQHAFLGTVDEWFFQTVAGIEPMAPGYSQVSIKPYPVGVLSAASAHVGTPYGQVASSWSLNAGAFDLRVTIPCGSLATVSVPADSSARVFEGEGGQAVVAERATGVALLGTEQGRVVYRVGSGNYHFRAIRGQ